MAPVRPSITFRLYKGEQLLREEQLSLPVIKVGKVPSSHLRVDDDSVSRMHAVIEVTSPTDVSIIDLGSTRGTYVNDQKVNKAQLQTGDVLQIGDIRIEVAIDAAAEETVIVAAPPPPPPPAPRPVPPSMPAPMAAAAVAVARPVFATPAVVADDLDGARAVEIAAMLGDSVVEVKHCMNPRSTGKVRPATYGILGAGAALIVVGMIWFAMGVQTASFNEAKLEHWTTPVAEGGLGKPAHAFRPRMLTSNPALYDGITFGGMLGGLVLMAWGVGRVRDERRSPWFHVEAHALVAPSGDDFMLRLAPGMDGDLTVDGQTSPLSGAALAIPAKARIRVRSGKTTYLVSSVTVPRRYPVPLLGGVEANVAAYFAGSAVFFLGAWALLRSAHGGLDTANGDDDTSEMARLDGATEGKEEPPPDPPAEEDVSTEEAGGQGQQMALTEGKAGKENAPSDTGRIAIKRNSDNPSLARDQAIQAAKVAGILGSESFASAAFTSLTGTGDVTSGYDDADIYGGFLGDQPGEANGGFGFGAGGFGPGGGGGGWGTIGGGPYGTIGGGGGTGEGYNIGGGKCGAVDCGRHKKSIPALRIGAPQGSGDLDKATIRRYIKRSLPKIKYCYEKELLAAPGLSGTVDTQFLINANGTVGDVHAKGVNSDVSSCVAGVIKAIAFPKPKSGGPVNVTSYPFEFHPSGG